MLTCFAEVASESGLLHTNSPLARVEGMIAQYDHLEFYDLANARDFFLTDTVTRKGLIRYIYFTETEARGTIGIEFSEVFWTGAPLWLIANFYATVS